MFSKKGKVKTPVTYNDYINSLELVRKKLGDKTVDGIATIIRDAATHSSTHWTVMKTDSGKLRYKCSACGHVTTVPTRCCTQCGASKLDAKGNVKKICE